MHQLQSRPLVGFFFALQHLSGLRILGVAADECGITLYTNPSPLEPGMSKSGVVRLLRRNGWRAMNPGAERIMVMAGGTRWIQDLRQRA